MISSNISLWGIKFHFERTYQIYVLEEDTTKETLLRANSAWMERVLQG